ncbi:PucR family transcriptional regulator [Mycobacterium sp. GA-2829]|uniref:PucR family transcriptional regulator n=1 Tax=Mycobacterium sp. GA-2829 TaxID=1772283 RepID=UPI00073FFF51|nr:PucR family transcriptional regulator [Mycobacterium sp. GA-2829]KUI30024.1 PucR family transcriptional regulator [Mycobacterium sp. GA-2829]
MSMTVADVIALPVVAQGEPEVLSARRWHDPIRWVHVGDVADMSALLQGGELVLTTGGGLAGAPERYLRGLADAGAVGVVVELGTAIATVPDAVAAEAARLDLALIALHRQIKFVAVTEVVHRRIVAAQYDAVEFDRRVHETFTELSMKRASAAGIVDAAARILDEPVVLEDLAHQALAVAPGGDAAATLLQDWERRSRMSPAEGDWAVTSVGPRGEEWGRLIVPAAPADRGRATMVLERASAALALHRMIERNRSGLHQQAQSGLIDDVLAGRITDEREAAARAHALGLRRAARYLPLVVRVDRGASTVDPVVEQQRNVALLDAVAHTVNAAGHTALCSIRRDGEIGALLALDPSRGGAERALGALGDRMHAELRRLDGGTRSVCAVGDPAPEITEAIHGLGEAAHVGEVAIAMHGPQRVYRASDVRLRGLIALLRDDPRVQQFAETELRALLVDDDDRTPSNMDILREYLQAAGNKAALAQRLHISRPALYKRLAQIGRVLGVDLDDAESMTSLHVAVLIRDAQRRAVPAALTRGG